MGRGAGRSFRVVLFDLYDTLVWLDVEKSGEGRQKLATRLGVPLDAFLHQWRQSIDDRMLGRGGTFLDHLARTVAALGQVPDPHLLSDLAAIEGQRLRESVHLYPSTVPVLRRLSAAGYRLGLLSNVSDAAAIPITHLGIHRLFDRMILSYQVGLQKPDPAIFLLACRQLGAAPEETMFVADGGFGELDASHRLGVFSVLLEQDRQSKEFGASTRYDAKIHDLRELETLLDLPDNAWSE